MFRFVNGWEQHLPTNRSERAIQTVFWLCVCLVVWVFANPSTPAWGAGSSLQKKSKKRVKSKQARNQKKPTVSRKKRKVSRRYAKHTRLSNALDVGADRSASLLAKPRDAKEARNMERLRKGIDRFLRLPKLRGARLGVIVMTTEGRVLYAHKARRAYIPASNLKLLTIAAALKHLGYYFRFLTRVYGDSEIDENGVVKGNLYIKGGGDPSLRSEEMWRIVRDLHMLGLRKVTGQVIFDDSIFDRERFGAGWTDHSNQPREKYRPYLAPIGGLAINFSSIAISVKPGFQAGKPGRVDVDPNSYYIRKVINLTQTVPSGGPFKVRFRVLPFRGYRDQIEVRGTVPLGEPAKLFWRRVNFPAWYAAFQFAAALRDHRIKVSPWPKRGQVPLRAKVLYNHGSPSLGQILQYVGKQSSNFTSEQVMKMMGAIKYGRPGTWAKGIRAVQEYLETLGIKQNQFVMLNGSGLGRGNRVTPLQFATVLRMMLKDYSLRSEYLAAQATSGQDGTLRWRMKERSVRGKIRAKTGTLDGVSSLSGYVLTKEKEVLIFSICMNGRLSQNRHFRATQNKIGTLLARFPNI